MTQFLKTAQMQGAKIISGVEMFVHQAAMQFELFTGIPAPVSVMRAIVEERVTQ
jgi:shikimate dehydrogenase